MSVHSKYLLFEISCRWTKRLLVFMYIFNTLKSFGKIILYIRLRDNIDYYFFNWKGEHDFLFIICVLTWWLRCCNVRCPPCVVRGGLRSCSSSPRVHPCSTVAQRSKWQGFIEFPIHPSPHPPNVQWVDICPMGRHMSYGRHMSNG